MAKIQLKIQDHLLIPFGRPKWNIERVKIVGVSTRATYIESETPLVYIDRSKKLALRMRDFKDVFPEEFPTEDDPARALDHIRKHLRETCYLDTDSEKRFLDLYFEHCQRMVTATDSDLRIWGKDKLPVQKNDPLWVFDALLPLPQAHLYLNDPFSEKYSFVPQNMVKVDFAFWTGTEIVAVEIDGQSHIGSEAHIQKDRMLQRAGVSVIHILNLELMKHRKAVIEKLFPESFTRFWKFAEQTWRTNPLDEIPF